MTIKIIQLCKHKYTLGAHLHLIFQPPIQILYEWDPTLFVAFQRLLHGLKFSAELRSQDWNLCEFVLTVALCYKFSSSYQRKELYFFSNHSINTWLHCIPWSFYCKVGDSLLIRPKGDWSCAFTYSTSAMNNTTLLYGLQWLTLHNHVPIIQVFIWAVNSQPWLSHIISGAKKQERTSAHSLNTDALHLTGSSHSTTVSSTGPGSLWKKKKPGHLKKKAFCHEF